MSVRKRKWTSRSGEEKTAWIVDYVDQDGKRHIETFQRKKEADAREAKVRVDVSKGIFSAPSDSITVAGAAEKWINDVKAAGRERSTIYQYQNHIDLHIVPRIGRVKLAKLTKDAVKAFRDSLINEAENNAAALKQCSRPLARKVLTSFKALLKAANYAHLTPGVSLGRTKREFKIEAGRDFPEPGEVKRVIEAAKKPRHRALLLTAVLTGLRASELRGLRWSDVDYLKAEELHVRQRADRYNAIGPPKSEAGTRTIPLAPELVHTLKRWKLACPKAKAGLVFPTSTGRIEHHSNMLRSLAPVMKAAGVVDVDGKPKYALHAFRHFFASWCINPKERGGRELTPKVVQTLMGHSSIVITLDLYGHLFPTGSDRSELAEATRTLFA
jgi:integrase